MSLEADNSVALSTAEFTVAAPSSGGGEAVRPVAAEKSSQSAARDPQLANCRIAIVDDEPGAIQTIQKHLQDAGYHNFTTTGDSTTAWDLILSGRPDVVLLDLRMPVVSGVDILHAIRTTDSTKRLPVLIVTAVQDPQVKRDVIVEGATDFLHKPIDPHELMARVRNALLTKVYQDKLTEENQGLETEVTRRTAELMSSREEVIHCLARTAEYRDNDSGFHVIRVGKYVGIIADELGFPAERIELLELAARLHDLGKIAIPDSILQHPGDLDPDQIELMREHCDIGQEVLEPIAEEDWRALRSHARLGAGLLHVRSSPLLMLAATIAQTHHERWDGKGYPYGLEGEDIPIEGRMTALADVYDILSSQRPYKPAFSRERCCEILEKERGGQFDPQVLDAFFARSNDVIEVQIQYMDVD